MKEKREKKREVPDVGLYGLVVSYNWLTQKNIMVLDRYEDS
jgi:hypothetical protein